MTTPLEELIKILIYNEWPPCGMHWKIRKLSKWKCDKPYCKEKKKWVCSRKEMAERWIAYAEEKAKEETK